LSTSSWTPSVFDSDGPDAYRWRSKTVTQLARRWPVLAAASTPIADAMIHGVRDCVAATSIPESQQLPAYVQTRRAPNDAGVLK
jgi:hypothetical protein